MFQGFLMLILCVLNIQKRERCVLNSRIHFSQTLPILIRSGRLLEPNDNDGNVILESGDTLTLSCEGSGHIQHPNMLRRETTATISCGGGANFRNEQWLNGPSLFNSFHCVEPPNYSSRRANRTCFNNHSIFEVGYFVQGVFYPLYESCFNELTLNAVYSTYTQLPYNSLYQTKVNRPRFISNDVYGLVPVDSLFSPRGLKEAVTQLVGNNIVNEYLTESNYLSRGHLAAKTDFVFAFGERATFHYVNCAPQWYGLNSGNWNTLEVDLRNYIHEAGLDTIIYTGTYEVTQLFDENGRRVDIYLYTDENNNPVIPVPLYYYKVVYEPTKKRGIAFIGINGPYYTHSELTDLFFCHDVCRDKRDWQWLTWQPENANEGYSFCCSVPDFRATVSHLPPFEVNSLFK